MTSIMKSAATALAAAALSFAALAQEPAKPAAPVPAPAAPKHAPPVAIVGGDVQTVTQGLIRKGTVLLRDGKIEKVGLGIEVPKDYSVIDATGKYVMPGFVVASARGIGAVTGGGGGGFGGGGGGGRGGLRSNLSDGFDPYAFSVSLALASGITSAFVAPGAAGSGIFEDQVGGSGGGITGVATVMKPTEGDLGSMTLKEPAAVVIDYSGSFPNGKYEVRDRLKRAKEYAEKREAWEKDKLAGKDVKEPAKDEEQEILAKLVRGEIPARITAATVDNILGVVELAREFSMKVVIEAATEAWIVADELSKAGVGCVITPRRKSSRDKTKSGPSGSNEEMAAILRKAGVTFAVVPPTNSVATGGIAGRDLVTFPIEAAFAMRGGLDEQAAIEAITIGAARLLGVDDRVGSLEAGKDADVLVLDGNPLDYKTFVEKTYIDGKLYYDKDKSTLFSHLKRQG